MSVWWCAKCQSLSAFNSGICPTCGGQTSFANVNVGAAQASVSTSMTIGLCRANRHQICGPSDSFPPECDSCKREADETDAARYRWLRAHLGNGFMVRTEGGLWEWQGTLDDAIDSHRAECAQTVTTEHD